MVSLDNGIGQIYPILPRPESHFTLWFISSIMSSYQGRTGLCQSVASPAVMCVYKVVTVSVVGVIKTISGTANLKLNYISWSWYSSKSGGWLDVVKTVAKLTLGGFEGRGWRDTSLPAWRMLHSETVWGKKEWKKTWSCACSWCSLCAPLVGSGPRVRVVEEACWVYVWLWLWAWMYTAWWPVHVVIGHVPGCSSLYFFSSRWVTLHLRGHQTTEAYSKVWAVPLGL